MGNLFLLCKEVLTLDFQIEALWHVGDDVSNNSADDCDKPLEYKYESETSCQCDPIYLAVGIRA